MSESVSTPSREEMRLMSLQCRRCGAVPDPGGTGKQAVEEILKLNSYLQSVLFFNHSLITGCLAFLC